MKKSLLALATVAAAGAVSAQSSVTLWGIVDAAVAHGSGSVSSKTMLANSAMFASQLGFRGVEDLGGGMAAGFWLESGLNNDDGSGQVTNVNNQPSVAGSAAAGQGGLTFNRRSTVSVGGAWGELRLGRDYSPQFWNLNTFDPFLNVGAGASQALNPAVSGPTAVRASNSVTYLYGHAFNALSNAGRGTGLHGALQYYLEENSSGATTSKDGTGYGVRVGYNEGGPLSVALAVAKASYSSGNTHQTNVGGAYNFGVARVLAAYTNDGNGTVAGKGYLVGGTAPVDVGVIRVSYSRYRTETAAVPTTKKIALGYIHNLSKRTAFYVTWAHVNNGGNAAVALNGSSTGANAGSSGFDFGLKHSF